MASFNSNNSWNTPRTPGNSPAGGTKPGRPRVPSRTEIMERLKQEVGDQPDTRERRIRIVRMMLSRGGYHVDGDTLAEKLLEEAAGDAASRGKAGLDRWPHS